MALDLARYAALVVAVLVIVATLASYTRAYAWWVRLSDFPRQQLAILGAVALVGLLFLVQTPLGYALALTLAVALIAQLLVILPYTRLWRRDLIDAEGPKKPRTVRLLVANVLQDNREADKLVRLIEAEDPDLFLAVETDPWWAEQLGVLFERYPHNLARPIPNTYGLVMGSKLELIDPEVRYLLKKDVPSIRTGVRLPSGDTVLLYGIHPEPPAPGESDTSLPRDAELVIAGREIAEADAPTILMGDLNDVAWSHTSRLFRRLSGLVDLRVGRGFFSTFDANRPYMRWPLDHVFVTPDFRLRRIERLPHIGSDHFPILVELDYAPNAEADNAAPEPEADDREEADETLSDALKAGVQHQPAGASG